MVGFSSRRRPVDVTLSVLAKGLASQAWFVRARGRLDLHARCFASTLSMTALAILMNARRYTFVRSQRLKDQLAFMRVTRKGVRQSRGPLIFHAIKSAMPKTRLGIRISRRCGTAPVRNRVKRMLRESYRLMQHDWPIAVDLVITVKPHEPLRLAEYQKLLSGAMVKLVNELGPRQS